MYKIQFENYNEYKTLLLNKSLTLFEKQHLFEEKTQLSQEFWDVTKHQQYQIMCSKLHQKLHSIQWLNSIGKTHFTFLFTIIKKEIFLDVILSKFLISLALKEIESRNFLKNQLLLFLEDYLIRFDIDCTLNQNLLNLICSYTIELLYRNEFFINIS